MRITFINQFAWPDEAPTGVLLSDLARFLVAQGIEVHIVCGRAAYVETRIANETAPAILHRVPCARFSRSTAGRLVSYLTFSVLAFFRALILPRSDVLVTLTTPPMLSLVGTLLKMRHRRHFSWEMDLFPDVLVDTGMAEADSAIVRILSVLQAFARRRADGVVVIGECMRSRLLTQVGAAKLHVAENWADSAYISAKPIAARQTLTLLYSGNLGLCHDIETLKSAMTRLASDWRFHFRFAGHGPMRSELQSFCKRHGIQNASFAPPCSRHDLGNVLAEGDIGLVTQNQRCAGSVVPSKVYGLMAAGRPMLFIGPPDSTPARLIQKHQCGWQVNCGDGDALLGTLLHLQSHREQITAAANRTRRAFEANYDLPRGAGRLSSILCSSVQTVAASASGAMIPMPGSRAHERATTFKA